MALSCDACRCLFITILCLQLVSIIERQVFDFLGFMWTSIVINFLQIIFVIVAIFGVCQYRPNAVLAYIIYDILWIGWNAFIICFYLNVGLLNSSSPILNMGSGNKSWWVNQEIGCFANFTVQYEKEQCNLSCTARYFCIELLHAGIQCFLSTIGIVFAMCALCVFKEEYYESSQAVDDELEYIHMNHPSMERNTRQFGAIHSSSTGRHRSPAPLQQFASDDRLYRLGGNPSKPNLRRDFVRSDRRSPQIPSQYSAQVSARTSVNSDPINRPPSYSDLAVGIGPPPAATFI